MQQAPHFAMVAGEASGDLLASMLLDGLREHWPELQASGIGGPQMQSRGFDAWWPSERLSVNGYVEVLGRFRELLGIRNALRKRLLAHPPSLFMGIDAPDFNLGLEARLKAQGIKTVHFVCPSIWAWRAERVDIIRRSVDHVLCVFPFEPALLAQHGIAATYVGHPLASQIALEVDQLAARTALGLLSQGRVVAILPGSRLSEVKKLAPLFFATAALIRQNEPSTQFIVPAVPHVKAMIEKCARETGMAQHIHIVDGQSHAALAACDVTLIASGTATLEAALLKRPMVISYKVNWLTARMVRRKQVQAWVGLPNVLCGQLVVPEILQEAATAEALAQAVQNWLDAYTREPHKISALQQRFTQLHLDLRRDTATLAAHAIQTVLEN